MTVEMNNSTLVRAYSIMMDRQRMKSFFGREDLTPKQKNLIVKSLEDGVPGYGVESAAHSSFYIHERDLNFPTAETRGKNICGQVFKREGKESPADFSLSFQIKDLRRSGKYHTYLYRQERELNNAGFWLDFVIVGDGATMLMDKADWPEEVKRICGGIPDVFWRTCVEHICGNEVTQSPFIELVGKAAGITRQEAGNKLKEFIKSKFEMFTEPKDLSLHVWEYINMELDRVYRKVFKGFTQETSNQYPSGVMGVLAVRGIDIKDLPQERLEEGLSLSPRGWAGFTVCGDIAVTADAELLNNPDIVNHHDNLLNDLGGRANGALKKEVSGIRKNDVGNLPNPDAARISLNIDDSRNVLMYTDGLRVSYRNAKWARFPWDSRGSYRRKNEDFTATLLTTDPELALLAKRIQNTETGVRGDDGAYGYWGRWEVLQYLPPGK